MPGALPGERVNVRVLVDRARFMRAELLEVLTSVDDRRPSD